MQPNAEAKNLLEPIYADARKRSVPKSGSESSDRAIVKKEADRMIKEAVMFEKSKASWQKKLMLGALGIAGVSVVLNMVLGVALSILMPLKTVEPYVLRVNQQSGLVSIEQPLSNPLSSYGKVLDTYYLNVYVNARESHDWGFAQRNFDTVKAFSYEDQSTWNEYNVFLHSPKSPLAILADKARVVVEIPSDPIFDEVTSTAVIRFNKTVVAQDGQPSINIPKTYWIATLKYEYPNPKLKPEQRRLNPLGMKVPSYQVVQELGAR